VKLFYLGEDGKWVDTGRTETLDLQSNWQAIFQGLPYQDANGNVYQYKIEEVENPDWIPAYGQITKISGTNNWQVTLTNHYRWTDAFELPSTGGIGSPLYILIGLILISAPFVYGFRMRRRYGKGASE
jgi:LPXTG-motif cell wall-anchored protein